MASRLFTKAEEEAIARRIGGIKSDPTGIFTARVKPKIKEILVLLEKKKELQKLIE